jgi:hypothetical protein
MPTCRCADCGLLAIRQRSSTELLEVDEVARQDGFVRIYGSQDQESKIPLCSVRAFDLPAEVDAAHKAQGKPNIVLMTGVAPVLAKTRDCPMFTTWRPGFTPKEHKLMLIELEAKRLEFDRIREDRREDRRHQYLAIAVGGAIGVIAALLGAVATVGLTEWTKRPLPLAAPIIVQPAPPASITVQPSPPNIIVQPAPVQIIAPPAEAKKDASQPK